MQNNESGKLDVAASSKGVEMKRFWKIDREMLPYKLHFFLCIGSMGSILPYQAAIGINRFHLTASNLAVAFAAQQFLFILFKPGIGYLVDYFNRLKATIIALTVLQAVFCFLMITIPAVHIGQNLDNFRELQNRPLNLSMCQLCKHHQELSLMSSNLLFDADFLEQGLNCLKTSQDKIENNTVHCIQKNENNIHFDNISYTLIYSACNRTSTSDVNNSTNIIKLTNLVEIYFFISISMNNLKDIHLMCSYSNSRNISEVIISFKLMEEHCCNVPELSISQEEILQFSEPVSVSCKNKFSDNSQATDQQDSPLSVANFKIYQFWLFALCLIASITCMSSISTMSDTACYETVSKTGSDYGRQRTWGAISWGLICPFTGFLNDYTNSYMASWCLMVILCSLQIWNLSKMKLIKSNFSQNTLKDLKTVFSSTEFVAFSAGIFMNGLFAGMLWFYLGWFLTNIGGNELIIGLADTVQCFLGEVPFMFFSGWMIKNLGHFNIVSLALFAHGVRFFIYSYLYDPWWILPIEVLHGFTYGSFYSAMTSYAKLSSKPGTETTTQSVLCTTYEGLGAGIGCIVTGICFDQFGNRKTFFYTAFFCMFATCLNILSMLLVRCKRLNLPQN